MRYAVCLESDTAGRSTAHVPDLPGCFAVADGPRPALEGLFPAIPAYWAWLRRHGMAAPGPDDLGEVTLAVVEIVRDSLPGSSALFQFEIVGTLNRRSLQTCLERLAFSRADLLILLGDRRAPELEPRVTASLSGLAATEHAYAVHLGAQSRLDPGEDALTQLTHARAALVHQIRSVDEAEYGRIWEAAGAQWTLRKLLRRVIEEERSTVAQLAGILGVARPESMGPAT